MAQKKTFNNPDSHEREYTRLLLRYSKQMQADVNSVLLPRLDDIVLQYKVETRTDSWVDTLDSLMAELARMALTSMGSVVTKLPGMFSAVSKFNEGQFKLVVKANTGLALPPVMPGAPSSSILGVNVFRSEPFLKPLAEGWISENTALIKSLPTRLHPELEGIIRRGVMNGQSVKDLKDQIKARYGVTDYRAKLIAQDQTLKLNADLTRYRLQSVGVEQYVWRSVQDSRVRPEHADRNGETYSWKAGAGGEHPGQPVRCRCRAEAVWGEDQAAAPALLRNIQPDGFLSDETHIRPGADEHVWMTTDPDLAWSYARNAADKNGGTPIVFTAHSGIGEQMGRAVSVNRAVKIVSIYKPGDVLPENMLYHGSSAVSPDMISLYKKLNSSTVDALATDFLSGVNKDEIGKYVLRAGIGKEFSASVKRLRAPKPVKEFTGEKYIGLNGKSSDAVKNPLYRATAPTEHDYNLHSIDFERAPMGVVNVASVISPQDNLNPRKVNRIAREFDERELDPVYILRVGGEDVVLQGNHRVVAAKLLGLKGLPARIIER